MRPQLLTLVLTLLTLSPISGEVVNQTCVDGHLRSLSSRAEEAYEKTFGTLVISDARVERVNNATNEVDLTVSGRSNVDLGVNYNSNELQSALTGRGATFFGSAGRFPATQAGGCPPPLQIRIPFPGYPGRPHGSARVSAFWGPLHAPQSIAGWGALFPIRQSRVPG